MIKSFSLKKLILIASILVFNVKIYKSQSLKFIGNTVYNNEALEGAEVLVYEKDNLISQTISNDKGNFSIKLDYNRFYTLKFRKNGYCEMFAMVDGKIPEDKSDYNIKFEIRIPFFSLSQTQLNLDVFKKPITKVFFDGDSKFVDDPLYISNFYKELSSPTENKIVKNNTESNPQSIEKKYQLVGKVMLPNDEHSPYSGVKVSIYDSLQRDIYSTVTNKLGVFCFPAVNIKNASRINVEDGKISPNDKLVLTNYDKEIVADETKTIGNKAEFNSNPKNKLFEKLVRDTYTTILAGKIGVDENGVNKLLTNKFIYLMNENNEIIERVLTNKFGEFIFTKLPMDKNYIIAIDENDVDLSKKLKLYTVKDVLVNANDSIVKGKFQYKFLVNDSKGFYEMIVDDSKIKMDLSGKIAGDQISNPIDNLKLYLLNKDRKIIDSTISGKDGEFKFKLIPFGNQYFFSIKDTSIINTYKSVIIYDKNGKVIKYISVKNNQLFEYKLLQNDLSLLQEIYLYDPSLNLSLQTAKSTETTQTTFLAGKIGIDENGENKLLGSKFIYILNEKNEVIEKVKTNQFGEFLFTKLPLGKNYIIAIDESDVGINKNLKLYTVKDLPVNINKNIVKDKYQFKFLVNDSKTFHEMIVDDTKLSMDLIGKISGDQINNAISNLKLYLLDKERKIIDSTISGDDGLFKFKYIKYGDQYYFSIKDTSLIRKFKNVIIYDKNGKVIKIFTVKNNQFFEYKLLQNDINMMQEIYLTDPWMNLTYQISKSGKKAPITIMENIYFKSGKADIEQSSKITLDKIAYTLINNPSLEIEIGAHSDSKGSDELNLSLSEKRAQSALNYFLSKGLEKSRIKAIGYGEKKLLNKCGNGVNCTDQEHAVNRRLEFKVNIP